MLRLKEIRYCLIVARGLLKTYLGRYANRPKYWIQKIQKSWNKRVTTGPGHINDSVVHSQTLFMNTTKHTPHKYSTLHSPKLHVLRDYVLGPIFLNPLLYDLSMWPRNERHGLQLITSPTRIVYLWPIYERRTWHALFTFGSIDVPWLWTAVFMFGLIFLARVSHDIVGKGVNP